MSKSSKHIAQNFLEKLLQKVTNTNKQFPNENENTTSFDFIEFAQTINSLERLDNNKNVKLDDSINDILEYCYIFLRNLTKIEIKLLDDSEILDCLKTKFVRDMIGRLNEHVNNVRDILTKHFGSYESQNYENLNPSTVRTILELEPLLRTEFSMNQTTETDEPQSHNKKIEDENEKCKSIVQRYAFSGSALLAKQFISTCDEKMHFTLKNEAAKFGAALEIDKNLNNRELEKRLDFIFETLEIDIEKFECTIDGRKENSVNLASSIIMTAATCNSNSKCKNLIRYFKNKKLPLDGDTPSTNIFISLLSLLHSNKITISEDTKNKTMEYLVNYCNINLNTEIQEELDIIVGTPFCHALGYHNANLTKFLLKKGANPLNFQSVGVLIIQEPDFHPNLSDIDKTFFIIEEFILSKYSKEVINIEDEIKSESPKLTSEDKIRTTDETYHDRNDIDLRIKEYINIKEGIYKNNLNQEQILKNNIDILVLKWISQPDKREEYTQKLDELLSEAPELSGYSITSMLQQNISIDDAREILSVQQKLFDKFCKIKKSLLEAEYKEEKAIDNVTAENIYKIHTNEYYKNSCFFKLPKDHGINEEKLKNITFVSRSSKGENGIKLYKTAARLKIDGRDEAYYSKKCLIDDLFGNTLYIFNESQINHEAGKKMINSGHMDECRINHNDFLRLISSGDDYHYITPESNLLGVEHSFVDNTEY